MYGLRPTIWNRRLASLTTPIAISSRARWLLAANDLDWLKLSGTASCALIGAVSDPTVTVPFTAQHVVEAADLRISVLGPIDAPGGISR